MSRRSNNPPSRRRAARRWAAQAEAERMRREAIDRQNAEIQATADALLADIEGARRAFGIGKADAWTREEAAAWVEDRRWKEPSEGRKRAMGRQRERTNEEF